MKKVLMGLVLGYVMHMLYLDGIAIYETKKFDACLTEAFNQQDPVMVDECVHMATDGVSLYSMHKGKFFNIAMLLSYKHLHPASWRME